MKRWPQAVGGDLKSVTMLDLRPISCVLCRRRCKDNLWEYLKPHPTLLARRYQSSTNRTHRSHRCESYNLLVVRSIRMQRADGNLTRPAAAAEVRLPYT